MMTPQAQRIVIAEACGWGFVPSGDDASGRAFPESWIHEDGGEVFDVKDLPNYPADLNALHEAEESLNSIQALGYVDELNKLTTWMKHITPYEMIHATAAQRAEAFLRFLAGVSHTMSRTLRLVRAFVVVDHRVERRALVRDVRKDDGPDRLESVHVGNERLRLVHRNGLANVFRRQECAESVQFETIWHHSHRLTAWKRQNSVQLATGFN